MPDTIIIGDKVGKLISEALHLVNPYPRRIILDIEAGLAIKVYIETYADEKLLEIDWDEGLKGAIIQEPEDRQLFKNYMD